MGIGQFFKLKGLVFDFESPVTLKDVAKGNPVELCRIHFFGEIANSLFVNVTLMFLFCFL